jgi:urease accessory protein
MFDATSPSDAALGARAATLAGNLADGRAEIGLIADGERTRLAHLYQHEPLRVLFPTPATGDCLHAALVTTSGGLVGGDRLSVDVQAARGARVLVSPQAAEKVYRSMGADCRIEVALTAAAASWLEFLPQETILFDGARLARVTRIEAEAGARVFAGEMLVFGRIGRGERLTHGFVRDAWEVRRDGSLVWADTLLLDGDVAAPLAHPAGFDGATACAAAIYVGSDAGSHLETARDALADCPDVRCGATLVNDVLVARFLGRDARVLREAFAGYWRTMRHRMGGLPPRMPQLWHI